MDTGSSVMLTGPPLFRLTECSLTNARFFILPLGMIVVFMPLPFLLAKSSVRDG